MLKAGDLRRGKTIIHEDEMFVVHDIQHVAKGNKRSYMQAKLKNYKSGQILDVRFRVDDNVEVPFVESKDYEFLYHDGTNFIFMDKETFEQIPVYPELIGDGVNFLVPNTTVSCEIYEDNIIAANLPNTVELTVEDTPPAIKGATATNQLKEAQLETGYKVKVPPFIEPGERIRVDTRTGDYIERAK